MAGQKKTRATVMMPRARNDEQKRRAVSRSFAVAQKLDHKQEHVDEIQI